MHAVSTSSQSLNSPLWWDNTGVIVTKSDGTLFRASCAILARESSVFAGMFMLPQNSDKSSIHMYEGSPFLELEDTAEDIHRFMDALHMYR